MTLLVVLHHHREALEHELITRYGWCGDEILSGVRVWNHAAILVSQIAREPYSHLAASLAGFAYVPHPMDAFFYNWMDAQALMHHKSGKVPPKPAVRPWTLNNDRREVMPDPDRSKRRGALAMRLGLGRVVDADDEPDGEPEAEGDD